MTTEIIDKLFLELSQLTNATTKKELYQQRQIEQLQDEIWRLKRQLRRKSKRHD